MDCKGPKSTEGDGSFRLQISEHKQPSDNWGSSNIFEPQREATDPMENKDSSIACSISRGRRITRAPEKKLTLFALRLAILEKVASGLGALGFIWATVVLLGGFAITLDKTDFWFITIILLIEGTRIFSRSHELEWQHQATWSITDAGINSFRALKSSSNFLLRTVKRKVRSICTVLPQSHHEREITHTVHARKAIIQNFPKVPTRTWTTSDVPLLPYAKWVFLSRNISKLLYWLQLLSASACVTLSLIKLIKQNFGEVSKGDSDKRNRNAALNIFYSLAFSEAMLFLLEKAYWEWNVMVYRLLEEVNKECAFGPAGMVSVKRFFYDAYSKCVNGSIFDGLKMDLVSFGMELLASDSIDEQLTGSRILQKFATNELYSDDTLQKIGISIAVMERLVEMLNWKDPEQEEIRRSAAEILAQLAGKKQNSLRVAGIPGAMESISSLLYTDRDCNDATDEICQKTIICDQENYEFSVFNHLGLLILKKLARDHDNCGKMGNTRGLLPKIIDFTHVEERWLRNDVAPQSQIMTVKRSLQVIKMLASTTGTTGKLLRQEISEIVFTISNIREILRHGEKHTPLQKLGIEILTSLALEEDATEKIGSTGGVLKELFRIFFLPGMSESQNRVRVVAGEAIAMLVFESQRNSRRILQLDVVAKLVGALEDKVLRVNAARILGNLCAYSGLDCFIQLRRVTAAAPTVLQAIMSEENKLQEVMLGLAAQVFKLLTSQESSMVFKQADIEEIELAKKLVQTLRHYQYPPIKVPRIRRFAIEMAILMMRDRKENIHIFKSLGLEQDLEGVQETTSELESFNVFSGTVGLNRHSTSVHLLVETALELLANV
ncbi:Arm repeat superfamily protein [Thalictrum thalictroides]|uniref:Arm repeat superfamily protein n=1 Tax=Thalictrum thalictroides TaxID=46969 RepID=A0A7J6W890_THATH|nr:Arm repeat superfamily protein [Thalictrum thalictroides]